MKMVTILLLVMTFVGCASLSKEQMEARERIQGRYGTSHEDHDTFRSLVEKGDSRAVELFLQAGDYPTCKKGECFQREPLHRDDISVAIARNDAHSADLLIGRWKSIENNLEHAGKCSYSDGCHLDFPLASATNLDQNCSYETIRVLVQHGARLQRHGGFEDYAQHYCPDALDVLLESQPTYAASALDALGRQLKSDLSGANSSGFFDTPERQRRVAKTIATLVSANKRECSKGTQESCRAAQDFEVIEKTYLLAAASKVQEREDREQATLDSELRREAEERHRKSPEGLAETLCGHHHILNRYQNELKREDEIERVGGVMNKDRRRKLAEGITLRQRFISELLDDYHRASGRTWDRKQCEGRKN